MTKLIKQYEQLPNGAYFIELTKKIWTPEEVKQLRKELNSYEE